MTIGEKIKYFRTQKGITQRALADLADIHPVSIRKYETNKMQPQPAQLERVAAALGVSYNALIGVENNGLRLETVGDLMGVLMVLCNSGVLQIIGERGEDKLLKNNSVIIRFNPLLASYIEILHSLDGKENKLSLEDAILNIKRDRMVTDLLKWEKMNFLYQQSLAAYQDSEREDIKIALNEMLEIKEQIELELQHSNDKLFVD